METNVVGIYIHGLRSSELADTTPTPMLSMGEVEAVEGRGLRQDKRYFRPVMQGRERARQVSLIDEGTIWRHEAHFGPIDRRTIKSQIILKGEFFLPDLLGEALSFASGAELTLAIYRKPCFAMDLIAQGLREAMEDRHQGALARVSASGRIVVGDKVVVREAAPVGSTSA